jgi:hypothetical protein
VLAALMSAVLVYAVVGYLLADGLQRTGDGSGGLVRESRFNAGIAIVPAVLAPRLTDRSLARWPAPAIGATTRPTTARIVPNGLAEHAVALRFQHGGAVGRHS